MPQRDRVPRERTARPSRRGPGRIGCGRSSLRPRCRRAESENRGRRSKRPFPADLAGGGSSPSHAAVGAVNPVVGPPGQAVGPQLLIARLETGQQHLPLVGLAVAIGIFEKQDVGRGSDKHAAAIRQHAGRKGDAVGENRRRFRSGRRRSRSSQQANASLVGPDRIIVHFGDEHPAGRVPGHGHGADDGRLGGDQLDHQVVVGQLERLAARPRAKADRLPAGGSARAPEAMPIGRTISTRKISRTKLRRIVLARAGLARWFRSAVASSRPIRSRIATAASTICSPVPISAQLCEPTQV